MRLRSLTTLAITTTAIALTGPAGAQAGSCTGARSIPTTASVAAAAGATLCLANRERAAVGAPPLTLASGLSDMAAAYGRKMVNEAFFAHTSPDGSTLIQRLNAIGDKFDTAGENLYWGDTSLATPAATVDAWMHSPDHRENLLDPGFHRVGIAIVLGAPAPGSHPTAATYVADFDSGNGEAAHTSRIPPAKAARRRIRARRAKTVKRAVKTWFEAARLGDGRGFCRIQDNRMLKTQYGHTGAAGIRTCVSAFHAVPALPAAAELSFPKVRTTRTRSTVTVLAAAQRVKFVLRKINRHWKIDSITR